jgi:hypothetical protein
VLKNIDRLYLFTSEERHMVISASNGHGLFRVGGSGDIEAFRRPVVSPTSSGPEEGFVSYFIDH